MTHHRAGRSRCNGFTLVEILAVILVIGILFGLGLGAYSYVIRNMEEKRAMAELQHIRNELMQYQVEQGGYPTLTAFRSIEFRSALPGTWRSDGTGNLLDPWDSPYVYSNVNFTSFILFSCGHDRQTGTPQTDADNVH